MTDGVPFLDLKRQHATLAAELQAAISTVIDSQAFVLGSAVAEFETAMASYLGTPHAIGVANGTDALYLSLRLLDLQPGDEVITSPFTFFSTAGAIHNAGGRPVFADINPKSFNLDPGATEATITDRTRAILPVHLFGQMADMESLMELAERRELTVIEDAAQAIGARRLHRGEKRRAGSVGQVGCFSFYPTKNLGGWGDGGMVATGDDHLAEKLRSLRVHGQESGLGSYEHQSVGINSRLDALQAAVLRVKLARLDEWNESRRAVAASYDEAFAGVDSIVTPPADGDAYHVYNVYTIRAQRRDQLRDYLAERGIGTSVYYHLCLHQQPCFSYLGYQSGAFPEAERAAQEVISLPMFPELTEEEVERVVTAVTEFYAGS